MSVWRWCGTGTWCHTLTESWATGIPVLGSDRGAVGDRIREDGGGWLVDGDASPAEIHAVLVALRGIPDERKARIDEVRRWQLGEGAGHTTAWVSEHYLALYRAIAMRHRVNGQWPCKRTRSEEHTSELQSLMRISYAVFCLKKK